MREILFRGKRKDNGEWVYGNFAKWDYVRKWEYFINRNSLSYEVIPETVGQYAGLTDKNVRKIFEDDIIEFENGDGKIIRYVVFWSENEWAITDSYSKGKYGEWKESLDKFVAGYSVVVGNIHDNPELVGNSDRLEER